jgi:hypothetical protein
MTMMKQISQFTWRHVGSLSPKLIELKFEGLSLKFTNAEVHD